MMESLNTYNYEEQLYLKPTNYEVTISDLDKVIEIMGDGSLLAKLGLDLTDGWLTLTGKDNMEVATVELPGSQTLMGGEYDKAEQEIVLRILNADSSESEIRINVEELVDVYQNGNGIEIDEERHIHIKINENSASILDATENGLGINLSDYATIEELNEEKLIREDSDLALSNKIKAESDERKESDDILSSKIEDEALTRENADNEILDVITMLGDDKVSYTVYNKDGIDYKTIVLDNHANLLGKGTDNGTYNLAMVSKWDVADFGSASLHLNLNSKDKVTINDSEELAYMSDIDDLSVKINEINDSLIAESVDRKEADIILDGKIDGVIKNLDDEILRATTRENELDDKIKNIDGQNLSERIDKNAADISIVNTNLVTSVNAINQNMSDGFNTINQNMVDGFNAINGGIENEIKPRITELEDKKVPFTFENKEGKEFKHIVLDNDSKLMGTSNGGKTYNLAMMSNYNTIEVGASNVPMNIRSSERISINNTEKIAYLSEINGSSADFAAKLKEVKDSLNNEVVRATESEETITRNYQNADASLQSKIETESNRAINAENKIDNDFKEADAKIKEELEVKVDWTNIPNAEYPNRKSIVLKNNDLILGTSTNGGKFPLIFMNRWDVVDAGSPSFKFNINTPNGIRPTVQEANQSGENANKIAYLSDVEAVSDSKISNVELKQEVNNPLHYTLLVDGIEKGDINIPKDQFLKDVSYDIDSKELVFIFETKEGDKEARVNISSLIDVYTAGNGLTLTDNEFSIDTTITATKESVDLKASKEELANEVDDLTTLVNDTKFVIETDFKAADETLQDNIDVLTETKVPFTNATKDGVEYKTIVLDNHANLLGKGTDNGTYNLAMVSKWDVADFGSASLHLNLNSNDRPTFNDDKEIALVDDVTAETQRAIGVEDNLSKIVLQHKLEIDTEVERAVKEDARLDKKIDDLEISSKNYTDSKVETVKENINLMIDIKVDPVINKFNLYSTTEKMMEELNENAEASTKYTDDEIKEAIASLDTNIDNKISSAITESEQTLNVNINKNATDIVKLSSGLNDTIYTGGTGIVDDVYKITHDLIYDLDEANLKGFLKKNIKSVVSGDGVNVEDGKVSIKLDEASESYLTVSENGLKLDGVKNYVDSETLRATNEEGLIRTEFATADKVLQDNIDVLTETKVPFTNVIKDNVDYKAIVLENHANLLGKGTDNGTYNLAMVSKWDVADFGSSALHLNLNSVDRPTFNDDKEIALVEDIKLVEVKENDKVLTIDENYQISTDLNLVLTNGKLDLIGKNNEIIGTVNIPKDQFLKDVDYNSDTKIILFTFETLGEDKEIEVDISGLIDVYTAGNGLKLVNSEFLIDDTVALKSDIPSITNLATKTDLDGKEDKGVAYSKGESNTLLADKANVSDVYTKLESEDIFAVKTDIPDVSGLATKIDVENADETLQNNIDVLTEAKVSFSVFEKDGVDYKTIVLDNHSNLLGKGKDGNAYNLSMVSKWDVADFGTTSLPINLNGSKERPTYNDNKDIALVSDFNEVLKAKRITNLESESKFGDYIRLTNAKTNEKIIDIVSPVEAFSLGTQMMYKSLDWMSELLAETVMLNGSDEVETVTLTEDKGPYLLVQMTDYANSTVGNSSYTEIKFYAYELKDVLDTFYVKKSEYDELLKRVEALENK